MADWIKCHRALTKGNKRSFPRATRFVYLELCLEARELDGVIPLRSDMDPVDAIHDTIGGNRDEIAEAWKLLSKPLRCGERPMVSLSNGELVIEGWEAWAKAESSAERTRRYRAGLRADDRDVTVTSPRRAPECHSDALEERREEKKREEEIMPSSPEGQVLAGLRTASDLWGDRDLAPAAKRIAMTLEATPEADAVSRTQIGIECATAASYHRGKYPHATPEQLLDAAVAALKWITRDIRNGKFKPRTEAQTPDQQLLADATASEKALEKDMEQRRREDRAKARSPTESKSMAEMARQAIAKLGKGKSDGVSGSA